MTGFVHVGERDVHQGHVWKVVVADFESPDGERFQRDIVRSPGAVAAVPLLAADDADGDDPTVVLVVQYRPPYGREVVEIPAGMRDVPGEPTELTARRELAEEAGLAPGELVVLTEVLPSPGLTDSVTTVYLATGCTRVDQELHGPEEEHSRLIEVPLSEAVAMVERGEIADAKSVAGLLLTARRLRR